MERRSYGQFCGLARALDIVGERWTLLIVRNLLAGPLRYGELQSTLPGITTNLLAKRLREMQDADILERTDKRYSLTPRGLELEPAVMALGRWGESYLRAGPRGDDILNIRWGMVSLKRRYRGDTRGCATFLIDDDGEERRFTVEYGDGVRVTEDTGQPDAPAMAPLVLRGPLRAYQGWLFRRGPPKGLAVEGSGFDLLCESFGLSAG